MADMKHDLYGEDILGGLCDPGRLLVFVDDTGTPGKPLPNLAADYVALCGVSMPSEKYRKVKGQLIAALTNLGADVQEFHAKEIVHPNSKSAWRRVPATERMRCLSFLTEVLAESSNSILFNFISGEQYYPDILPDIIASEGPEMNHKDAVKKVFLQGLIDYLRHSGMGCSEEGEVAIVIDSPKPLGKDKIELHRMRNPQGFYQGSVIYADSRLEVGLQLADFAAYTINRVHHVNQRQMDGKMNRFDEIMKHAGERIQSKLVHLLDLDRFLKV